jgi:hypothetical protein
LILVCILLSMPLASAQGDRAAADPVTGNWGSDGRTFLELTFDGKKAVTGTAIWRDGSTEQRTPIKTGSFERATGTLRLEGEARGRDGAAAPYLIEGKIEKDTVSGTFKVGNDGGQFTFKKQ